jgi:hypothetical protein
VLSTVVAGRRGGGGGFDPWPEELDELGQWDGWAIKDRVGGSRWARSSGKRKEILGQK